MKGVACIFYWILRRRYRVHTEGIERLKKSGAKLLLPNHPAHIDPQILTALVRLHCDFVPVVSEQFANLPFIGYFIRRQNAVVVSDLKFGNRDPNVLNTIVSGVLNAFEKNKSVIIYPAGGIKHTSHEVIKNKQSVHAIVRQLPEHVTILGVRIHGLWGSMWSVAWNGKRPNFLWCMTKGIFYFFLNLVFFLPKRNVRIEFVDITTEVQGIAHMNRQNFNSKLEEFYNVAGPEKVCYLKHGFFFPKLRKMYPENLTG